MMDFTGKIEPIDRRLMFGRLKSWFLWKTWRLREWLACDVLGRHDLIHRWEQTPSGTRYLWDECDLCGAMLDSDPELEGEVIWSAQPTRTWIVPFRLPDGERR